MALSVGLAGVFTPVFAVSLGSLPGRLASHGSATISTVQQIAGAAGTALFITVMTLVSTSVVSSGSGSGVVDAHALAAGTQAAFLLGGIVSSIGSAASHKIVLENPDSISRVVLEKGLDAGTAFEILSIDIADIDVGKNIGAQLQMDQAQADKNIAQAKAEERRAMAVALEQENKAKAQDARAKVILAEAEVPLAMAEAFRNGNLGIMDYYKMKNIMADTSMRETIARPEKK